MAENNNGLSSSEKNPIVQYLDLYSDPATNKYFKGNILGDGGFDVEMFRKTLDTGVSLIERGLNAIDTNKDGKISISEFMEEDKKLDGSLSKSLEGVISKQEITDLVAKHNGNIPIEEITAVIKKGMDAKVDDIIGKLDKNHDGVYSLKEVELTKDQFRDLAIKAAKSPLMASIPTEVVNRLGVMVITDIDSFDRDKNGKISVQEAIDTAKDVFKDSQLAGVKEGTQPAAPNPNGTGLDTFLKDMIR